MHEETKFAIIFVWSWVANLVWQLRSRYCSRLLCKPLINRGSDLLCCRVINLDIQNALYCGLHTLRPQWIKTGMFKLSITDVSLLVLLYADIYGNDVWCSQQNLLGHCFIRWTLFVNFCQLGYAVNRSRWVARPNMRVQIAAGSDERYSSYKIMTPYFISLRY